MIVTCCNECPFFRDTPVLGGMLRFLGGDVIEPHAIQDQADHARLYTGSEVEAILALAIGRATK